MAEITLQAFYEQLQSEGMLFNSLFDDMVRTDSIGTEKGAMLDRVNLLVATSDEDRRGTVLDPNGVVLNNFKLNPLFLFEHGLKAPPHESIIGRINAINTTEKNLIAEAQYIPLEHNTLPGKIWDLEKKGLIPCNSMGWRPLANITEVNGVRTVGTWELLEVSKVLIPVNGKASNRQLAA